MLGNCGGGCCACNPPTNADMTTVAANAALTFVRMTSSRIRFLVAPLWVALWAIPKSQLREGNQDLGSRPAPVECTFIGPHRLQDAMIGARRADQLNADR